jgi:hypothetical protein
MKSVAIPIIGVWKLVTFEFRKADGSVFYPYGEKAQGSLICTEAGRYSVQLKTPAFKLDGEMAEGILLWERVGR